MTKAKKQKVANVPRTPTPEPDSEVEQEPEQQMPVPPVELDAETIADIEKIQAKYPEPEDKAVAKVVTSYSKYEVKIYKFNKNVNRWIFSETCEREEDDEVVGDDVNDANADPTTDNLEFDEEDSEEDSDTPNTTSVNLNQVLRNLKKEMYDLAIDQLTEFIKVYGIHGRLVKPRKTSLRNVFVSKFITQYQISNMRIVNAVYSKYKDEVKELGKTLNDINDLDINELQIEIPPIEPKEKSKKSKNSKKSKKKRSRSSTTTQDASS